ncbi:MAG TPA: OB-fold nucleic acid binding domain-containing protein, partial [Gemmatimonadales bacterium]|nr:OB-fold nucleic acid binding domain-containing protein [Gemmatimonadales bacterium]
GFYSLDALGRDAARHGIAIKLPDVNLSDVWCTVEAVEENNGGPHGAGNRDLAPRVVDAAPTYRVAAVRVGLGFLREWGEEVAAQVVLERERHGPFRGLGDLVRRAPPKLSRSAMEHLVWVGGCDAFGLTRRELLWQLGLWLPPLHAERDTARVRAQLELPLNHPFENLRFAGLEAEERLFAEYAVLGFAAGGHPLMLLRGVLPPGVVPSDRLPSLESGMTVETVGLVVARQRPQTAKGYVFLLLEDEAGMINVIVRPDVYQRDRLAIRGEPFLWVRGTLQKDGATLNMLAEDVRALKTRRSPAPHANGPWPSARSPYAYLKTMRRVAPDAKSWG